MWSGVNWISSNKSHIKDPYRWAAISRMISGARHIENKFPFSNHNEIT